MYKIFLLIAKNLAAFLAGAIVSIAVIFLIPDTSPLKVLNNKDIGFAIIPLLPILAIYMGIVGALGGIAGMIAYNVVSFFIKRSKKI